MEALSPAEIEDDGSVFTESYGVKRYFKCGERVYPCCNAEAFTIDCAKYGRNNTVQTIWLGFDQPISAEDVTLALWVVSRQVPHLQFCITKRRDKYWLKRMPRLEIDFEVTSKAQLDIHNEMLETFFDLWKGPLWKVRLNLNYKDGKVVNKRKYSAYITLCVHHSITDAPANILICKELVEILNKVSKGETVTPILAPVPPTMDETAIGKLSTTFVMKKACKKIFSTIIKNFSYESTFNGALQCPKSKTVKARFQHNSFTKAETEMIVERCKASKITVNSFILTVANFALMAIAQAKSKVQIGPRKIVTLQAVNMRRYLDAQYKVSSGCHTSYIEDEFQFSLSDAPNFWQTAKEIHLDIKDRIEIVEEPIKNIPLMPLSFPIVPINNFLTAKGYQNRTICHYFSSNMGNLKDTLPGPKEGDNIEITNFLRSVSGALCGVPFLLAFHTFRDRLMVSVDYSINTITDETAQAMLSCLFQYVRNIIYFNKLC